MNPSLLWSHFRRPTCDSTTEYEIETIVGDHVTDTETRTQQCERPAGHDGNHEGGWFEWPDGPSEPPYADDAAAGYSGGERW